MVTRLIVMIIYLFIYFIVVIILSYIKSLSCLPGRKYYTIVGQLNLKNLTNS